jgi:putative PIN family toxin of toxin-antitoxin system
MKAILDTNVVISACFWKGAPHDCLIAWAEGRYEAAISPPQLMEYQEVFEELMGRYPDIKPVNWVAALGEAAELVFPVESVRGVSPDPFDDMVLECALGADADFLVSGDKKHLLPLGQFRDIPIIRPADFLARLK